MLKTAGMRPQLAFTLALSALASACAVDAEPPPPPGATELERVWGETIRRGDVLLAVPGTGGYDLLGKPVDRLPSGGTLDGRMHEGGVNVLEALIASARRAGISDAELEAGAVDLAVWGAGITTRGSFRYHSVDGLDVEIAVAGGTSVCASGSVFGNLANYTGGNAERDADDLHRRVGAWLATDGGAPRRVIVAAHSWGAVVAEHLATHFATLQAANGKWPGATLAFAVAFGVPALVPGFHTAGAGIHTVESTAFDGPAAVRLYEVTRPDDPIRTLDPTGNGAGHHYIIRVGTEYLGVYGITTDELACAGEPGACP